MINFTNNIYRGLNLIGLKLFGHQSKGNILEIVGVSDLVGEPYASGYTDRNSFEPYLNITWKYPYCQIDISNDYSSFRKIIDFKRHSVTAIYDWYSPKFNSWLLEIKIFNNMIAYDQKLGIEKLFVYAIHQLEINKSKMGRLPFSSLGFTMIESYQNKFNDIISKNNRVENSLHELLSKEEGIVFWQENGFSYIAEFDLMNDSINIKIHNDFLKNNAF